jgi:UDP-N-acetylmuramyl-tripeptide synthetase
LVGTLGVGMPQHSVATTDPNQFSFDVQSNGLTTPDPVLLQHSLRTFVSSGLTACAIEASSIGLAEHRMDGTHIRVAVFTNFTQDHLDYHGSMQAYWEAKKTLFQWPGLHAAVINIDDEKGAELAHELACSVSSANLGSGVDVWTVSCQQPARVVAHNIGYDAQGLHFTVREGAQSHMLATRLVGQYNVSNLLGVIAAMRALDVPLQACVDVCASLESVPGRLQCLGGAHEPMVVVDYAHTPDALAKTLEALRPLANVRGGKLWCVFGCGGNRDASKRPLMGAVAARHADQTVVTSDNPRSEKPQAIISQILLGMAGQTAVRVQADRALAVAEVIQSAERADVVLVAGKGHETFQEVDGQKLPFVDAQHVLAALALRGTAVAQTGATN